MSMFGKGRARRGDVAFVLLVVVAIAAVLSAGMVLVIADRSFVAEAEALSRLSSDATAQETYAVAVSGMLGAASISVGAGRENETLATRFVAAAGEYPRSLAGSRGYFERVATGGVTFVVTEEGYELRIQEIPITVVQERQRLQRHLNLLIAFDGQGGVHKVYKEYRA